MKKIKDLIKNITTIRVVGPIENTVVHLCYDSRKSETNSCFFAIVGTLCDGHSYIPTAIEGGASTIVCQTIPQQVDTLVTYIQVEDTNIAMAQIASAFYGDPSKEVKLIGITGTNGKTTTVTLLYDMFRLLGHKVGMISTITYKIDSRTIESTHTTPDAIRLNMMLREMVNVGCEYCFMEVSSHSIVQKRIEALHFAGGIFSNITHDHLDYHKTFAEYIKAKQGLFNALSKESFALTNIDDRNGMIMVQNSRAKISTLSLQLPANFRCKIIEIHLNGMLLRIDGVELWVKFTGRFNGYNMLTVYSTAMLLGENREDVLTAMSQLDSVSGRFEHTTSNGGVTAIIDYAHTPDALKNVIETINEIKQPSQQLYVVCGCGGDRDKTKRPEMARIATEKAYMTIFTSDNPRTESAEAILDDMVEGISTTARYLRITNREEAIKSAVMLATNNDIILIAGKGHETYQIIGDTKEHFDDKEVVTRFFKTMNK